MKRALVLYLGLAGAAAFAQNQPATPAATPPAAPPEAAAGMVITGDQEAPLVLYIVPWQSPRLGAAPEVDTPPLMPRVLDHELGILDDPLNRAEPVAAKSSR